MEISLKLRGFDITNSQLAFNAEGTVTGLKKRGKLRLILCFLSDQEDRRIPMDPKLQYDTNNRNQVSFHSHMQIDLKSVFTVSPKVDHCIFWIEAVYERELVSRVPLNVVLKQHLSGVIVKKEAIFIPPELFACKTERKIGFINFTVFILCTLCLPVFLLDGLLATLGLYQRYPKFTPNKGVISIIKHANYRVLSFTGLCYSRREMKTLFFRYLYNKAKKKALYANQILLLSERKQVKDENLYMIKEELYQRGYGEIKQYYNDSPIGRMKYKELKYAAHLIASAKIIILDDFYPQLNYLNIREETTVIQLWHACGAFKTFGYSRIGKPGGPAQDSKNHRNYDFAMVSSENIRNIYSEAFGIPFSKVKALGVPRTDIFFSESYQYKIITKLYQKYPQLRDKNVVLLAPTFRGDGNLDAYYPMEMLDLNYLCTNTPEDYVFIIKHHPFVKEKMLWDDKYQHRILDLTREENINHLLFISNYLVTDYSSVIYEASLFNYPIIFYAFDQEEYFGSRDIYYDFSSFAPGPIVKNIADLVEHLNSSSLRETKMAEFRKYFMGAIDGKSTVRIADFIEEMLNQ